MIATIPLFYMVHNIARSAFSISAGEASDKNGGVIVLIFGYGALLLSYLILTFASSVIALGIGFLMLGLFSALTDGVQRAIAGKLTNVEVRGAAHGLLNAAIGIGALCSGVVGGYLWQFYGPTVAFAVASVAVIGGLTLLLWCRNNKCL
jgi:MFS family permease